MWALLTHALYKRKFHRLCLNSKWTFVGNNSNKVLINPLLVILYSFFTTTKPLFTTTLLFVEYINLNWHMFGSFVTCDIAIYIFDTLGCHYIKYCCILK